VCFTMESLLIIRLEVVMVIKPWYVKKTSFVRKKKLVFPSSVRHAGLARAPIGSKVYTDTFSLSKPPPGSLLSSLQPDPL
jgi:hypothetical protein